MSAFLRMPYFETLQLYRRIADLDPGSEGPVNLGSKVATEVSPYADFAGQVAINAAWEAINGAVV